MNGEAYGRSIRVMQHRCERWSQLPVAELNPLPRARDALAHVTIFTYTCMYIRVIIPISQKLATFSGENRSVSAPRNLYHHLVYKQRSKDKNQLHWALTEAVFSVERSHFICPIVLAHRDTRCTRVAACAAYIYMRIWYIDDPARSSRKHSQLILASNSNGGTQTSVSFLSLSHTYIARIYRRSKNIFREQRFPLILAAETIYTYIRIALGKSPPFNRRRRDGLSQAFLMRDTFARF